MYLILGDWNGNPILCKITRNTKLFFGPLSGVIPFQIHIPNHHPNNHWTKLDGCEIPHQLRGGLSESLSQYSKGFNHPFGGAGFLNWAVFKIPLSFHDTGWFNSGFLYWMIIIPNILISIIPYNQPTLIYHIPILMVKPLLKWWLNPLQPPGV